MKLRLPVCSLVVLLHGIGAAYAAEPMNVLLIISDDLRNEMGCYGSEIAKTPRLDELAARGVRFDRAYCQFPLCNPSRSSMLNGRHPTTTGVLGNRQWFGATHPEYMSLPKYFKEHGYATLRSGKIFHGGIDDTEAWTEGAAARIYGEDAQPVNQSRTPPGAAPRQRSTAGTNNADRGNRRDRGLTKAQRSDRYVVLTGDQERTGDHRVADRAIGYLQKYKNSEQPFFLACGFSKPHAPLVAPQRFFDMFRVEDIPLPVDFATKPTVPDNFPAGSIRPRNADLFIGRDATEQEAREMIRAYLASTAWMDWNAGRVLDELDRLGLRENTVVVFWGDHGFQLGEKGKWSKAGSLWEQGARVPMFIYDPRISTGGQASPRVVQSIDIYPTLVELCGLPPAKGLDGLSLKPLIDDPRHEWNHPAYTVWSEDGEHVTGVVVRNEHFRYAEFYGRGAGAMLIDPEADPAELTNLVTHPEYSEVVDRMSRQARRFTRGHRPPGSETVRWRDALNQPKSWYGSAESIRIAENLLLYQNTNGGWAKNIEMARVLTLADREKLLAERDEFPTIIDNGATHTQMKYLARMHAVTGRQEYADAVRRGIEFLLAAQYENGGWPMFYPAKQGYYEHITFNDDAMIGVMTVLRDVAQGTAPYEFVEPELRSRAQAAIDRGLEAILHCQIEVDGVLTAWCAQHDEHDFSPQKARTYELPSISGMESVGIVRYLMELENPSPAVRTAIESAIAWYEEAKIEGIAVERIFDESLPRGYDKVVVQRAGAKPLWARFYEIGTNRPMFVGRDGVIRDSMDQIEHERRVGYRWLGDAPAKLLTEDYPAWKKRWQVSADLPSQSHYLFSYFVGNGEDGLHLAHSTDGLHWESLHDGKSFLTPTAGHDKLMRDPSIVRGPDGDFHMVWTVSWGERGIGYASSRDLITWSPQQFLPVMEHEPKTRNCWAPELFYDEANEEFLICWASTVPGKFPDTDGQTRRNDADPGYNHRMYYTTTKDFETFADTKLFYDHGFNVIDAALARDDNRYFMILKDETDRPYPPQKNLRIAFAEAAAGPYSPPSEPITGDYWAEGPTPLKIGDRHLVYFDKYRDHRYGAVASTDLEHWTDVSDQIKMPRGMRHGTAFEAPAEVVEGLLELE